MNYECDNLAERGECHHRSYDSDCPVHGSRSRGAPHPRPAPRVLRALRSLSPQVAARRRLLLSLLSRAGDHGLPWTYGYRLFMDWSPLFGWYGVRVFQRMVGERLVEEDWHPQDEPQTDPMSKRYRLSTTGVEVARALYEQKTGQSAGPPISTHPGGYGKTPASSGGHDRGGGACPRAAASEVKS